MELDRGQCFCCGAGKVLIHNNPEACENLFTHLYRNDKDVLDEVNIYLYYIFRINGKSYFRQKKS